MMALVTVCNQIDGTRAWSPERPFSEVRERPVLWGATGSKGSNSVVDWSERTRPVPSRSVYDGASM